MNPYDIEDDGCRCGAYYAGECACGQYVDYSHKRVWQEGFDAAKALLLAEVEEFAHNNPGMAWRAHLRALIARHREDGVSS